MPPERVPRVPQGDAGSDERRGSELGFVGLELGLELEKVSYDKVLVSADRREALVAFAEKRRPVFAGK